MSRQYKSLEKLLVIQAIGLDAEEDGLRLTLSSAEGSGKPASCLSNTGKTVASALEKIRVFSFEEELFCDHTSHILIGEAAAKAGIEDLLSFICHSPELRIDLPIYIIKDGLAEEAMMGVGTDDKGTTELLDALGSSLRHRGDGNLFTAAEVIGAAEDSGCALVCALEYANASEQSPDKEGEPLKTLAAAGYAVLKEHRLAAYISREDAVGVGFLTGKTGLCELSVEDPDGNRVTLEIDGGSCKLRPIWDEYGRLSGLRVDASVSAAVLEAEGHSMNLDSPEFANYLVAQLEKELSRRIASVLRLSKDLRADFLGLAAQGARSDPENFDFSKEEFSLLLPKLELKVSVQGRLSHTNDLKDA